MMEIRCENCGLIFEKQHHNQRYCCDECRRKGNRRKTKERYKQQKAVRKIKNKKPTLSEINNKARAAGMTYGKYMAQEYGKQVKVERRK